MHQFTWWFWSLRKSEKSNVVQSARAKYLKQLKQHTSNCKKF
jgi:hypothetical protein